MPIHSYRIKSKFFHGIQHPYLSITDLLLLLNPFFPYMKFPLQQGRSIYYPLEHITHITSFQSAVNGSLIHKLKSVKNVTFSHFLSINMFYSWLLSCETGKKFCFSHFEDSHSSRRMPRFQELPHCQNIEEGGWNLMMKITTQIATVLVLMAPSVLVFLLGMPEMLKPACASPRL